MLKLTENSNYIKYLNKKIQKKLTILLGILNNISKRQMINYNQDKKTIYRKSLLKKNSIIKKMKMINLKEC